MRPGISKDKAEATKARKYMLVKAYKATKARKVHAPYAAGYRLRNTSSLPKEVGWVPECRGPTRKCKGTRIP